MATTHRSGARDVSPAVFGAMRIRITIIDDDPAKDKTVEMDAENIFTETPSFAAFCERYLNPAFYQLLYDEKRLDLIQMCTDPLHPTPEEQKAMIDDLKFDAWMNSEALPKEIAEDA